jgi:hypothetical protein
LGGFKTGAIPGWGSTGFADPISPADSQLLAATLERWIYNNRNRARSILEAIRDNQGIGKPLPLRYLLRSQFLGFIERVNRSQQGVSGAVLHGIFKTLI